MGNQKTVTLPVLPEGRCYVSLSDSFSHRVVIKEEGIDQIFTVNPLDATDEANDSAYDTGYGRYIYPGVISPMKDGTRLDAVKRKDKNFKSDDFRATARSMSLEDSEGKKHVVACIRNALNRTHKTFKLAEEFYATNGKTPEEVYWSLVKAYAHDFTRAEQKTIFSKNWPREKANIAGRVQIERDSMAKRKDLDKAIGGLDISGLVKSAA